MRKTGSPDEAWGEIAMEPSSKLEAEAIPDWKVKRRLKQDSRRETYGRLLEELRSAEPRHRRRVRRGRP